MKTEFKDVAHLYIGCDVMRPDGETILKIYGVQGSIIVHNEGNELTYSGFAGCRPVLRSLSDISKDEMKQLWQLVFEREFRINGAINFFEKDGIYRPARFVMLSGVERLGIELTGNVWYDSDLHRFDFSQHKITALLLQKGFDLFGLIDSNQAINKLAIK